MTNVFLSLPGAIATDGYDVAAHYGSPLPEQRALETGDAVVDLEHRGIVTVSGVDRLSWLHSMTSQQLVGLAPGVGIETLLLDANGRIEQAIRVVDDGEQTWLLVDEGKSEALEAFLRRMRFAMRVEVRDVSAEYSAVAVFDAEHGSALSALRGLGTAVAEWRDPWAAISAGGVQYSRGEHPAAAWSAVQLIFARSELPAVVETVKSGNVRAAGLLALDALEVQAWRPSLHGEVDERSIPHELDWLRSAVHLTKGCYRGQETVAKVHNLGRPPRRIALLHLDGSSGELPGSGALIYRANEAQTEGSRPVGRTTRVALHHEWGGIALALLKRSVPEDAELEVVLGEPSGENDEPPNAATRVVIAASQEVIVPSDAGRAREIPRLSRL
ncbi:MAG: CAF17-like 4Fe-4S cluster assembly/insertion protein YgfZ [Leucobacter sp.]